MVKQKKNDVNEHNVLTWYSVYCPLKYQIVRMRVFYRESELLDVGLVVRK